MAESVKLQKEDLEQLAGLMRGPVMGPGTPGYDDARSVWNGMIDRRPGAIARCLGVGDVVAAVSFASERGLAVAVKGGGHNIAGLGVCDGGLLLDMSLMRGVLVDPAAKVARAQAGCLLGDVDRETQLHGLAAVLGFVSNTGTAGLTLGGGFGYMTTKYGWTCDNTRSFEMVTADGRIVEASASQNPELLWGLRGGGGNFGVVTRFDYDLMPVGPEIVAGGIAWSAERAEEVLALHSELSAKAPPELALVALMRIAPPAPWLAKEIHGKPIVGIFVCHTGPVAEGEKLVAPLKALGGHVGDIVQKRTYVSQQSLLDATQPKGRRYYWKSEYLPGLDPELLAGVRRHVATIPSPHSAILLFPLGGAVAKLPDDHSAAGNRGASWVLNIASSWERPEDDDKNIGWTRTAWEDLKRFSTGGTYVNFLTQDDGDDRVRAAYGKNYDRLAALKKVWDPANLFRVNKNIAPR